MVLSAAISFALVMATAPMASASPAGPPAGPGVRDVVFVANAEGGTVSIIDADSVEVLRTINVVPDGKQAGAGEDDPVQAAVGQRLAEAAGGDNFAQDQDVSPDGRTLYVSRGHRGDVAAFETRGGTVSIGLALVTVRRR